MILNGQIECNTVCYIDIQFDKPMLYFFHFRNLAKSIREKATDMALGLVQSTRDLTTATPKQNDTPKHTNKYGPQVPSALTGAIKIK